MLGDQISEIVNGAKTEAIRLFKERAEQALQKLCNDLTKARLLQEAEGVQQSIESLRAVV